MNDQGDGANAERPRTEQPQVDRPQAPSVYGFTRAAGPLLNWGNVEERLRAARNYWLATVYPDGRPHVTPVWGVWVDGMLFVSGFPKARWARNLAANPSVAAHLESGDEVVIVEGVADDVVTDAELGARIVRGLGRQVRAPGP